MSPRTPVVAALACVALAGLLLLGPRARVSDPARTLAPPNDPVGYVSALEAATAGVRTGDAKEIVWADPDDPAPTEVSVVYLHGFSADRHEISPVAEEVASALGANLFFTRLTGHGQDGPALGGATASDWLRDTDEAVAIGQSLGRKVVLIGTSTGGTLALWAAAREAGPGIAAVVAISPNFGPADSRSRMLLWPWGGLIARLVVGKERCFEAANAAQARHWTTCYPVRALLPMMALVEHVRNTDLGRVTAPTLVFYSSADEVVDARETVLALERLGGPVQVDSTGAGDGDSHVLAGEILSPGNTERVVTEIVAFLRAALAGVEGPR